MSGTCRTYQNDPIWFVAGWGNPNNVPAWGTPLLYPLPPSPLATAEWQVLSAAQSWAATSGVTSRAGVALQRYSQLIRLGLPLRMDVAGEWPEVAASSPVVDMGVCTFNLYQYGYIVCRKPSGTLVLSGFHYTNSSRRKFRSQTSDNMITWRDGKAEVGRVREEEKRSEKIREEKKWEERRCRCAKR